MAWKRRHHNQSIYIGQVFKVRIQLFHCNVNFMREYFVLSSACLCRLRYDWLVYISCSYLIVLLLLHKCRVYRDLFDWDSIIRVDLRRCNLLQETVFIRGKLTIGVRRNVLLDWPYFYSGFGKMNTTNSYLFPHWFDFFEKYQTPT